MADDRKDRLINLGSEKLTDALLELAIHCDTADTLIQRLIASPLENIKRFKNKLSGLKRSKRFIDWRESGKLARDLEMLLQDLKAGVADPVKGVELVAAFYETDESVFGRCDDSSGHVGDVFRFDAKTLFVDYASKCEDKAKVASILLKLNQQDSYGVRDVLIDCASDCLPEPMIRDVIAALQDLADKETEEYGKRHYLRLIESLARQIKDARLFEKKRIAAWGGLSTAACVDVAHVYLESDDTQTAQAWLDKIPMDETFQAHERDQLQIDVYRKQGNTPKLAESLHKKFRLHHSTDALGALLNVIGEDKREKVIADEVALILESSGLRAPDAAFLVAVGRIDEAEEYLLDRAELLDGDNYPRLLSLADSMVSNKRHLAASLIYRCLLMSILQRGSSKAYSHAVRYLKKLDKIASEVDDWTTFADHEAFQQQLHEAHGRKRSFWSRYQV